VLHKIKIYPTFTDVKINNHIVSKYLAAYFIALPLLFGMFSYGHKHYSLKDREDTIQIESSVDCSLCDLYDHQTAVIFTTYFQALELPNPPIFSVDTTNLISIAGYFNCLRGPPYLSMAFLG
tara:strand:- start:4204 stop:4569 length:366 start_codon:yes stop_codon:yes gene_type:complete